REGRVKPAFLARTVSRSSLRKRRSAISEPAGTPSSAASGGRAICRQVRSARPPCSCYNPEREGKSLMQDTTAPVRPAAKGYTPADNPRFLKLHRRFPTIFYLRQHARRHVPSFAFEYMDGGAGADGGIARNWSAFDAVELVPRYGVTTVLPP